MFDMSWMTSPEGWMALVTLTAMKVVLGIDNMVFHKGYVYFAMAFSVFVEALNIRMKRPS